MDEAFKALEPGKFFLKDGKRNFDEEGMEAALAVAEDEDDFEKGFASGKAAKVQALVRALEISVQLMQQ